jgi:tetratricopeptide (TPR) repeat protein
MGFAVVLLAACGRSDEEAKRPLLPVPQCEGVAEESAKSFGRLVHAMDRSGELAAVAESFRSHRQALEKALAARDPTLPQRLKPVLDKHFSDEALRTRAACMMATLAGNRGVAVLDEWSRKPGMRKVGNAIWTRTPTPSEDENEPMTQARRAKLRDIATAMALQQIQANIDVVAAGEATGLVAALDSPLAQIAPATARPDVPLDRVVDQWLIPALIKTPDEDLDEFLGFAESAFGSDFYAAVAAAFDFRNGDWYARLYEELRDASATGDLPEGLPGKEAVIAEARQLLRNDASPQGAANALSRLLQVERNDPRNPEVHVLLSEALIRTAPVPLPAAGELRAVIETPNYATAEKHLQKALELAPENADAHMWLGRLRWLQGRDQDAMASYQRAGELDPKHPLLDLNLGDVFFTGGDFAKAARYYLAVTSRPEGQPFVHYIAMAHLQLALRRGNRIADFPRYADAYLARNPEAWGVRLDYADYLMSTDARADRILAAAEPVPDAWLPQRKVPVVSAALMRKASEQRHKKTREPIGPSLAAMQRAIALNPDPRMLAEAACRADVDGEIAEFVLLQVAQPKTLANALAVCGLRWQRLELLRVGAAQGDPVALSLPQPDLNGDTPLCYAAAIKNVRGFGALTRVQVNPGQKCNDGNLVSERLSRMSYGGGRDIEDMKQLMERAYRRP